MGKAKKNKNTIKLRLLPSCSGGNSLFPRWVSVSNREFTNDEKQGIREMVGNVYFQDEPDDIILENNTQGSDILIQKGKMNKNSDADILKDSYFPDDGYDYEQHLRTINKDGNYINSASSNKLNQDQNSLLLNSTSVLSSSDIDVSKRFMSELVELVNCMEEPDDFEELNDDFILDMTGLKNQQELESSININDILWGGEKLQTNYKDEAQNFEEPDLGELLTQSSKNSSIFSFEGDNNDGDEEFFETVLDEYSDNFTDTEQNTNELCSNRSKNNIDISEYEHILDNYINQAKSKNSNRSKLEKNYEICMQLDKLQIDKIISILENTEICDSLTEDTPTEDSEFENTDQISNDFSKINFEVINQPNKLDIFNYYSCLNAKPHVKHSAPIQQKDLSSNKELNYDHSNEYDSNLPIVTFLPLRKKGETSEERRNRKQAAKQAKREMRDLKRKNKQDTRNLKKSVVGSLINTNNNDIKSGVRYFRF